MDTTNPNPTSGTTTKRIQEEGQRKKKMTKPLRDGKRKEKKKKEEEVKIQDRITRSQWIPKRKWTSSPHPPCLL